MKFLMAAIYFGFVVSSVVSSCAADIVSKLTNNVFQFEQSTGYMREIREKINTALITNASKPKGRKRLELIGELFETYTLVYPGSKVRIIIGDRLEFFPTHPDDSPGVGSQLLEEVELEKSRIKTESDCTNEVLEKYKEKLLKLRGELLDKYKSMLAKKTIEKFGNF